VRRSLKRRLREQLKTTRRRAHRLRSRTSHRRTSRLVNRTIRTPALHRYNIYQRYLLRTLHFGQSPLKLLMRQLGRLPARRTYRQLMLDPFWEQHTLGSVQRQMVNRKRQHYVRCLHKYLQRSPRLRRRLHHRHKHRQRI
jgi:hypothetical protein